MKEKYFIIILLFLLSCSSQKLIQNNNKKITPPGTIHLIDNLFFDETEISNISYKEMIYWYKKKFGLNSEIVRYILPVVNPINISNEDTLLNTITYTFPYLNSAEYNNYPVVGITYNQAVLFCKWRSDRVNELYFVKENKIKTDTNNIYFLDSLYEIPQKVKYRLPTKEEWEFAASGRLDTSKYKLGYKNFFDKNNIPKNLTLEYFEIQKQIFNDSISDNFPKTENVYFGEPNQLGFYNLIGNVSEIIQDENICKGLNWNTKTNDFLISKDFFYSEPNLWLGFRCICELYD